ncbi:GFA family protein [Pseudomonas sp. SCB32]|uniref:GFA family protein n=1 Tax=Pseudomonas sp. SCB32 TaxID=2653853 RepID=UPI001264E6F3|nr:GFA family protein [Pseudomonas sp. SCB32]
MTNLIQGHCHCANISVQAELSRKPDQFTPRACDCDFCRKHGAAYISDAQGKLSIQCRSAANALRYHQGSGTVDFLLCRHCGVLVAALWEDNGRTYAALNAQILDNPATLGAPQPASPRLLPLQERMARWRTLWFADVRITQDTMD